MSANDLLRTPLNAWHRAHGARMVAFSGWEMPVQYERGILQEHLATRKYAGLFDVSHMGRFRIRGQSAVRYLQRVLSNNVQALSPWQAQYTLIPNEAGGVIDDAYLYRIGDDEYLLVVNASNRDKDWDHLQKQRLGLEQTLMEDSTAELSMIALQGPMAGQVLSRVVEDGVLPEPAHNSLSQIRSRGTRIIVSRTGYTGEPIGFELFVPAEKVEALWTALLDLGGELGVVPVGLGARDTLRLEAGMPLYGHEFGPDPEGNDIPALSFPLAAAGISFSERKGKFVGRDALTRQFKELEELRSGLCEVAQVLPRRTRGLAVLDKGVSRHGDVVFMGNRKVGVVTSGTMVPYWEFEGAGATRAITDKTQRRAIALAYLDASLRSGQCVEVDVRGRRLKARIVRWHGRSDAPPYFRPVVADHCAPGTIRGLPTVEEMSRESWQELGTLDKVDVLVKKSIENHEWRQMSCMNLIPSEMTPSPLVRLLQVSDPVGRYAEHKELLSALGEEIYYYQGTDFIQAVEERLIAEMGAYLGCPLVETRTVSGQMANMTVFSAVVDFKNRTNRRREPERIRLAMNNHIGKGGHLSSQPLGALRDYVAKDPITEQYAVVNFPVCRHNPYSIDIAETGRLLERFSPEIMILGKSMVLHPEPVSQIRRLLQGRKNPPIILYDMAHVLGLIGPHFQEPFKDGADIVTGSTHKTFFGTQRGVIGCNFSCDTPAFDLWKAIRRRAFPGMVSNHHLGTLLGLLVAALEMNAFRNQYQPQVISNAKAFARALCEHGLRVEGDPALDFTETHQVILNAGYTRGCEGARLLESNNIIVNYQALPGDEGFTASSGLRMGVSEMTRFGMTENDFRLLAGLIAGVLVNGRHVGAEVAKLRRNFLTMKYCFTEQISKDLARRLLNTF